MKRLKSAKRADRDPVFRPTPPTIRSLRRIRIDWLATLLELVEGRGGAGGGYLSDGTESYARKARAQWKRACKPLHSAATCTQEAGEVADRARAHCVTETAREIRAEIAGLEAMTDEAYASQTRKLPLAYWHMMGDPEIAYYARQRGLEARWHYEHFPEFGPNITAGMGGYYWFRGDKMLTNAQLGALVGDSFIDRAKGVAQWQKNRIAPDAHTQELAVIVGDGLKNAVFA
jgi:hypothetical protein